MRYYINERTGVAATKSFWNNTVMVFKQSLLADHPHSLVSPLFTIIVLL